MFGIFKIKTDEELTSKKTKRVTKKVILKKRKKTIKKVVTI